MLLTPFKFASSCFEEDYPGAIWHDYCYFMRHGETSWNTQRRIMGGRDIPLSERGIHQAYDAQQYVQELGIQTICTSPLQRAQQTARILNEVLNVPLLELGNLKEMSGGDQEGQIRTSTDAFLFQKSRQGSLADNVEPYEIFEKRVLKGFQESLTHPGPVLIVSHGGVFWALATYFNWPVDKLLTNCEVVQIFFPRVHGEWIVRPIS